MEEMDAKINEALRLHAEARTVRLVTYDEECSRAYATGALVEYAGRLFVMTASHCLDKLMELREANKNASIQTVLRSIEAEKAKESFVAIESYAGYILKNPEEPMSIAGVESRYGFSDLAALEVFSEDRQLVSAHKQWISESEFATPEENVYVQLTGFRAQDIGADENLNAIFSRPFTFRSPVRKTFDRLVVLAYDSEECEVLKIEPCGISGTAVYNDSLKFVGMLWAGSIKNNAIYVTPAPVVLQFMRKHIAPFL